MERNSKINFQKAVRALIKQIGVEGKEDLFQEFQSGDLDKIQRAIETIEKECSLEDAQAIFYLLADAGASCPSFIGRTRMLLAEIESCDLKIALLSEMMRTNKKIEDALRLIETVKINSHLFSIEERDDIFIKFVIFALEVREYGLARIFVCDIVQEKLKSEMQYAIMYEASNAENYKEAFKTAISFGINSGTIFWNLIDYFKRTDNLPKVMRLEKCLERRN